MNGNRPAHGAPEMKRQAHGPAQVVIVMTAGCDTVEDIGHGLLVIDRCSQSP